MATNLVRILVVDDSPEIHEDFRQILRTSSESDAMDALEAELFSDVGDDARADTLSVSIGSALQGEQAIEMVGEAIESGEPFTVAFVDVRMPPGLDGIKTSARLLDLDPAMQVVVCTAYSDYSWDEVQDALGYTDRVLILKKPFEPIEVRQLVHALERKCALTGGLELEVEARTRELSESYEKLQREVEERERAEAELRLTQRLEAIGQLAAGIAHEINTPLQYMNSNLQFIQSTLDIADELIRALEATSSPSASSKKYARRKEQLPGAVSGLEEGLAEVARIVKAMKAFASADHTDAAPTDLKQVIEDTLIVARPLIRDAVEVEVEFDAAVPAVWGRGGELGQMLMQLILNAVEAIREADRRPGTIRIRVRLNDAESVLLEVEDNGCGISPGVRESMFNPFFTTKPFGQGGGGQGLPMVRAIVAGHRGRIEVESTEGAGALFQISLPILPPQD